MEQLVNSVSKLAVSISEFSFGTKGALIFLFCIDSQLILSNHGWSFISLADLWPSLFDGSLYNNFFNKSSSFGEN